MISLGAIFCSFDPVPAGEETGRSEVIADNVPLPPGVNVPANSVELVADSAAEVSTPAGNTGGMILNNEDALKFSLLMMQDGLRFIENVDTYSTVFNKQERIQGDLSETQTIEMKVRHTPSFGIYMKWKNGDTGRQLLYNEDYDDKKMCVKLGGFKGRLLPAIKLEPTGPEAMAQARYPVTEAGILGMLKLLVFHRQNDLKNGQGVRCVRLEDAEFDDRKCYCFLYEYESPDFNKTYRKSLLMLDARYHVPLRIINHTWTENSEGLTAAEMDEQTLIEDYSFLNIDFGKEMVTIDFSRDNPAYRM
ncbi:MAG: DUF1571 domain-containing protein [Planctomycetaceae bacterium]